MVTLGGGSVLLWLAVVFDDWTNLLAIAFAFAGLGAAAFGVWMALGITHVVRGDCVAVRRGVWPFVSNFDLGAPIGLVAEVRETKNDRNSLGRGTFGVVLTAASGRQLELSAGFSSPSIPSEDARLINELLSSPPRLDRPTG